MPKRADDRYEATATVNGERKHFYGPTLREAKAKAAAYKAGKLARPLTVGEVASDWLAEHVAVNRRPRTFENYRHLFCRRVIPAWEKRKVGTITGRDVSRLLAAMRDDGLAETTVSKYRGMLAAFFAYLVKTKVVPENPVLVVETPAGKSKTGAHLEPDEARKLLAACRGERYEPLIVTALFTGLRAGELRGLKWEDWDEGRHVLHVRRQCIKIVGAGYQYTDTKTERSRRTVALAPEVERVLHLQREIQAHDRGYPRSRHDRWPGAVFTGPSGCPFDRDVVLGHFRRILARCGLEPRRLHDLRHSHASLLFDLGWDVGAVGEQLGHSSIRVTADTYIHLTGGARRRMADALQRFAEGDDGDDVL